MRKIDPITLTVVDNHLRSICGEMGIALMRSSVSNLFNESYDFSCVIYNKDLEAIAITDSIPAQIGAVALSIKWCVEEIGIDNLKPGDIVVHNDPYRGSCHLPEHTILKPIFYEDKLFGFVADVGHFTEVGAAEIGGFTSTEVYQEGLRLPPVKIVSQGEEIKDIWKIILTNHRTPRVTFGDLRAMIGTLKIGEKRLLEFLNEYGVDVVNRCTKELLKISEQRMRANIKKIPDGEYDFEDFMEDGGSTELYRIKVCVVVRGDELIVDFTGSDPQAKGPLNATYAATISSTYNAVLLAVSDPTLSLNSGLYKPIKVIAPIGTIVNVRYPGSSITGNHDTGPRVTGAVLGALSKAIPEKVAPPDGATPFSFLFGGKHPVTGDYYVGFQYEGVGWGARYRKDGNNALGAVCACRACMTSIEVMETRYPIMVKMHRLSQDSGGAGRTRGGLSCERIYQFLAPETTISVFADRAKIKPFGLAGGKGGGNSGVYYKKASDENFQNIQQVFGLKSPVKFAGLTVKKGDELKIIAPGAGGYGDPHERDSSLVLEDVKKGFISLESAKRDYGVNIKKVNEEYILSEE